MFAGEPVKYRAEGTRFAGHVEVGVGGGLPDVVGGECVGSETGDDVFYVGSPRWVGSGSDAAQRLVFGFGGGDEVEEVHAGFFLSVSVAISTRRVEWTWGLRQVGGLLVVMWRVMVLPQSGHR
jgi:hypothetical protein